MRRRVRWRSDAPARRFHLLRSILQRPQRHLRQPPSDTVAQNARPCNGVIPRAHEPAPDADAARHRRQARRRCGIFRWDRGASPSLRSRRDRPSPQRQVPMIAASTPSRSAARDRCAGFGGRLTAAMRLRFATDPLPPAGRRGSHRARRCPSPPSMANCQAVPGRRILASPGPGWQRQSPWIHRAFGQCRSRAAAHVRCRRRECWTVSGRGG